MQWIIQSKPRTYMKREWVHFETVAWWLDVNLSAKWFPRHRTCGGSYPCGPQPWYRYDIMISSSHHASSPKNDDTKTTIRINPNQEVTRSRLKTTQAEASLITSGIVLRWSFREFEDILGFLVICLHFLWNLSVLGIGTVWYLRHIWVKPSCLGWW